MTGEGRSAVGEVLVTGGTGVLGAHLVRELRARGREVRVLSRAEHPTVPDGVSAAQGDVRTGVGLAEAAADVNCIVHAATSPFRRARRTEVDGAASVLAAAADAGVDHVIYVSIVGVDAIRFVPYYRAKWAAEQVVEQQAKVGWTVQRITQFHELIDQLLRLPVGIRTPNMSFQSIAAADAAMRLADLVETGPVGRADDIGGPEILNIREMATQRRELTGKGKLLLPVPRVGPLRDVDDGVLVAGDQHPFGAINWRTWLKARTT